MQIQTLEALEWKSLEALPGRNMDKSKRLLFLTLFMGIVFFNLSRQARGKVS
jgi:hypothetical protein